MLVEDRLFDTINYIFESVCRTNDIKMRRYDGFVALDPEILGDDAVLYADTTPDTLVHSVNTSMFHFNAEHPRVGCYLAHLRAIDHKELRKRTGLFAVKPYELSITFEDNHTDVRYLCAQKDRVPGFKALVPANRTLIPGADAESELVAQFILAFQFWLENAYSVYIRPNKTGVGLTLPLWDLSQLKGLFTLRDIPEGHQRRLALKHWVAAHLRRKPFQQEKDVEIAKYLRGAMNFDWLGASVQIRPPVAS